MIHWETIVKRREFSVLILIGALVVVFSIFTERFLSINNISNLLLQTAGIVTASIGMTMVIITAGIDVSVGSTMGMACAVSGLALTAGLPALLVFIVAIAVGLIIGLFNGALIAYGEIPPIIVTLGTMNLVRALMYQVLGGRWISGIPPTIRFIGLGKMLGIPISTWIAGFLIIAFTYFLNMRPLGRYIYAVGNNQEAARISGINLKTTLVFVYALTGALVGFAGLIYVARTGIVQTNTGMGFELDVIAAVVLGGTSILGGRGTVVGSLLGALLVGIIKNGMILLNVPALSEGLVIGVLIIVSVLLDLLRSKR
ncbi:ABC transporter permease [Thermatribacter velox]|uniref:Autoinducer 2 import system permease protein LsrC n=1 Tax=Thermatribacter velox TaxID=3039681 RepID=A0ABZ2YE11_9BACT